MPADFSTTVDNAVAAIADTTAEATGFADAVNDLVQRLAGSSNEFGTSALVDTGAAEGDIPVLGSGGRLDNARLPEQVDVARVLFDTVASSGVVERGQRGAANGDLLWWLTTWINTPDEVLYGDRTTTTGGGVVPQGTAAEPGAAFTASNRSPLDFRIWSFRYFRPGGTGASAVQTAIVSNTLGSTEWSQVSGAVGDTLEFRLPSRSSTAIELRAASTGYRILSITGINAIPGSRMAKLDTLPIQADWGADSGDAAVLNKPIKEIQISRAETRSGAVATSTALTRAQARADLLVLNATKTDGTWLVSFPREEGAVMTVQNNAAMLVTLFVTGGAPTVYNIRQGEQVQIVTNTSGVFVIRPFGTLQYYRNGTLQTNRVLGINLQG